MTLGPGKHTVVASKSGYTTIRETINVKAGQKVERTFAMKEKAALLSPTGPSTGPTKQPCGKFLKRGAGCR